MNFTRLDVVGEARDEKRVNHAPVTVILLRWRLLWLRQVVGIVGRMSHLVARSENGRLRLKRQLPTAGGGGGGGCSLKSEQRIYGGFQIFNFGRDTTQSRRRGYILLFTM